MNNHVGWGKDGRCVWCYSKDAGESCLDPTSAAFRQRIINLERKLDMAEKDLEWLCDKHVKDMESMREMGRREGAREMQKLMRDLVWEVTLDEDLDLQLSGVELEE